MRSLLVTRLNERTGSVCHSSYSHAQPNEPGISDQSIAIRWKPEAWDEIVILFAYIQHRTKSKWRLPRPRPNKLNCYTENLGFRFVRLPVLLYSREREREDKRRSMLILARDLKQKERVEYLSKFNVDGQAKMKQGLYVVCYYIFRLNWMKSHWIDTHIPPFQGLLSPDERGSKF